MLRQIITPALWAIALLAAALGGTLAFLANRMDAESIVDETLLLDAELATKQQYLEQLTQDNAEWDETYTKTVLSFDEVWFGTTIGTLVNTISDIDAVFLIQTGGRLLYSKYANKDDSLSQHDYSHLVRSLQRNLTLRLNAAHTLRGYISFDGGVYLVGASTVWPEGETLIEQATRDRQRNMLVILEKLDPSKLSVIGGKLKLDTLTLTKDIDLDRVHHPLGASGYLTWKPKTPGADFLADLAVPVFLFTLSILIILALFWRRVDRLVRLLQRTDQTKSIFLSAVGHELKTPLNGITSGIALMHKTDLPTAQKAYLDTIERSSRELAVKVTQILDYTRLETSELELETVYFDLRTLLEDVVNDARLGQHDAGSPLALHIPANCPTKVIGDSNRIKQIVTIILSETLGAIGRGTISLALTAQTPDAKSTNFRLVASTTGVSSFLSPLAYKKFTDRSHTGDGTLSWNLATARYLAEAMGGNLSIVEDPQGRQQIHVHFVLGSQAQSQVDIAQLSCTGKRTLIVHDESGDHSVLGDYLSDIGFTVEYAENEQTTITILKNAAKARYLVFVGEIIGTENGAAVARNIIQALGEQEIDLVLMAYDLQAYNASALQGLEAASLLHRPVTLDSLLQLVKGFYDPSTPPQHNEILDGQYLGVESKHKSLEGLSILIVEDNPVSLNLLCKIVSGWHCRVTSATDGDEAVKAAENNSFDCILMDYHMPRMNGATATRKIRELGLVMPVLVISAASDERDIDDCMGAGATTFIAKPIATPMLKQKIIQEIARQNDA